MEILSGLAQLELRHFGELDDQLQLSRLRLKVCCAAVHTPHATGKHLDVLRSAPRRDHCLVHSQTAASEIEVQGIEQCVATRERGRCSLPAPLRVSYPLLCTESYGLVIAEHSD